jgi:hypothetical protein
MPADDDRNEVLTSLPRSRPQRRSSKRAGTPAGEGAAVPTEPRVAKVAATAARESAGVKPKPKAKAAPKPKAAAKAKPKAAAPRPKATATPRPRPKPAPAPPREEPAARRVEPPTGADVLQSAVRAAGEIAQVGVTIGRETVKGVLRRLPRP